LKAKSLSPGPFITISPLVSVNFSALAETLREKGTILKLRLTYRVQGYIIIMIQSFKDKRAQHLFEGKRVPEFHAFARQAEKRLRVLDAADTIEALMMLPGNRFKALSGKRQGQYSIRINKQWRICFKWGTAGPENVEIVDYH
jgi:proteic killer suppression protein